MAGLRCSSYRYYGDVQRLMVQSACPAHLKSFKTVKEHQSLPDDAKTRKLARRLCKLTSQRSCIHALRLHSIRYSRHLAVPRHYVPSLPLYRVSFGGWYLAVRPRFGLLVQSRWLRPQRMSSRQVLQGARRRWFGSRH